MMIQRENMPSKCFNNTDSLAQDISRLETDVESCDILFIVGEEQCQVAAHSLIFNIRCSNFVSVVAQNSSQNNEAAHPRLSLDLRFVNPDSLGKLVHYVYTGNFEVESGTNMLEMLALSSYFGLKQLVEWCSIYYYNTLNINSIRSSLNLAAVISEKFHHSLSWAKPLINFILENMVVLRDRQALNHISQKALIFLVKCGCGGLDATETWRLCLHWAKVEAGIEITKPPVAWQENEKLSVRNLMEGVVEYIQVLNIDPGVYAEEVEPSGVVSKELSHERYRLAAQDQDTSFHARPYKNSGSPEHLDMGFNHPRELGVSGSENRRSASREVLGRTRRAETETSVSKPDSSDRAFPNSRIIAELQKLNALDYGSILNSWCGKESHTKWTVIFRASEHNFQAGMFHEKCDGAHPSFVLLRSKSGCVGGGFTDIPWSTPQGKGRYVASEASFLFSLCNPDLDSQPTRFKIKKKLFAVSHHPDCGPVFGAGADLLICDKCNMVRDSYSNMPHSYENSQAHSGSLMGDYNFLVDEYEVLVPQH